MTDSQTIIDLDRKTRAIIDGARVAIQRLQTNGEYDAVAFLQGGGRTIARWCTANDVHPSREAEAVLGALPDVGFKERS